LEARVRQTKANLELVMRCANDTASPSNYGHALEVCARMFSGRQQAEQPVDSPRAAAAVVPPPGIVLPPAVARPPAGAIDVRTGQFMPGVAGGIVNPRNGQFYPDVGAGYINPQTGQFMPKQ
jgi:hypothetical protein